MDVLIENEGKLIPIEIKSAGKIQKEQNEYLNELESFRTYPYINFKDFKD